MQNSSSCWCNNPQPVHAHADARDWYCRWVPEHKGSAFYHFATIMYKLGITIVY